MPILTSITMIVTMLFWGGTFIAGRLLASHVQPASAAFLRFAIASIALLMATRLTEGRLPRPSCKQLFLLVLLGATGVFSYNICFFTGLHYISASRASLIIASTPVIITVLATIFLGEQLTFRRFGGILLSLTGAIVVISNGHPGILFEIGFGPGERAMLGCVASWAAYSLIGRTVLSTLSPLAAVCYSSIIGTLLLCWPALHEGLLHRFPSLSMKDWANLLFLGVCGTALGFSWYYKGIKKIGAIRAGVFINLVPFFAVLLAWLLLAERIDPAVLGGGVLVLTGVGLTNYSPKEHPEKED
jgi:drug/metabolite transporter (DMT)-like permease